MSGRGAVAAGEERVVAVGAEVLAAGGNAVDAVVAAGFASAVAEPALSSLGGGGFCVVRTAAGEEVVVDFFVDTPGLGLPARPDPHFVPVTVRFPGADQVFLVGMASVAVPGTLAGLLHLHRRFGRLPLAEVVEPAARLAAGGLELSEFQAYALGLLGPIFLSTEGSRAIYAPGGRLARAGDRIANPDLAAFLRALPDGAGDDFHCGAVARRVAEDMAAGGGLVTAQDLAAYRVVERRPLDVPFRGSRLLANPPPATGGSLVGRALATVDRRLPAGAAWGDPAHAVALVEAMVDAESARRAAGSGTTHVSVADGDGDVAAMTISNGEASGYVVPGTGVMLNNMLGEDDLHPEGFHRDPPGHRVASMMSPAVVVGADGRPVLALGSGGSKRIRSAVLQVAVATLALGVDLDAAVRAPRLHWDGDAVQAEPGWPAGAIGAVAERWPVREWPAPNMYFGGLNAVVPGVAAAGDPRRAGAARSLG